MEGTYDLRQGGRLPDLTIAAGGGTDHFVDPATSRVILNAPRVLGDPGSQFQLSACLDVEFAATFDAGVLMLWADDDVWAKLCFEYSPDGQPMVVSVVTRGVSDDANSMVVEGNRVWLRVSGSPSSYAFHASTDGTGWSLVRHFALPPTRRPVRAGFSSQSPTGAGCVTEFSQVRFLSRPLADLRDGT